MGTNKRKGDSPRFLDVVDLTPDLPEAVVEASEKIADLSQDATKVSGVVAKVADAVADVAKDVAVVTKEAGKVAEQVSGKPDMLDLLMVFARFTSVATMTAEGVVKRVKKLFGEDVPLARVHKAKERGLLQFKGDVCVGVDAECVPAALKHKPKRKLA